MSRRSRAKAEDDWKGWASDQEARFPVVGEALVTIGDRVLAASVRHRYEGGGVLVTLETGETRPVPAHWIEEV